MPKYKPLKYRDVIVILKHLGFSAEQGTGSSHQTWSTQRDGKLFAVTLAFHGTNSEFRDGTLNSIIRQSGVEKETFYNSMKKKKNK